MHSTFGQSTLFTSDLFFFIHGFEAALKFFCGRVFFFWGGGGGGGGVQKEEIEHNNRILLMLDSLN